MKKFLYSILAAATVAFSASSCTNDFLEEEMVATITQQYYDTETGLDALVTGMYDYLRYMFHNQDYSCSLWEDLNDTGADANQFTGSTFSATGSSKIPNLTIYNGGPYGQRWGVYPTYNDALTIIDKIDNHYQEIGGDYLDEAYRNKQKSVAYFAKNYMLYQLIGLMGDSYVPTAPTTFDTGIYYAPRTTSEELYKMMIKELEFAYQWLPEASAYSGSERNERFTKGAAAFFLAHLHLDRALGYKYKDLRNADGSFSQDAEDALGMLYKGGNYEDDLEAAIDWADKVIDSENYELEEDFNVHCLNIAGDYSDEESREIVWAMAADPAFEGERGNNGVWGWRMAFYYGRYTGAQWGLKSNVWTYGSHKGKTGLGSWGYDVYTDKVNDSRYDKTFYTELYPLTATNQNAVDVANINYLDSKNSAAVWLANVNPLNNDDDTKYVDWFNANKATYFGANSPYAKRVDAVVQGGDVNPNYTTTSDKKINKNEVSLVMIANDRDHAIDADLAHSMPFVVSAFWSYYEYDVNNDGDIDIVDTYTKAGTENSERRYYNGQYSYRSMAGNPSFGTGQGATTSGLPFIKKYIDPNRLSTRTETGSRNLTVYRLSDMYLLRAWANGLLGNWELALDDINELRERAAYKAGETRSMAVAQFSDYYNHGDDLTAAEKQYPYTVATDTYDRIKVSEAYWTPGTPEFEAERYPHFVTEDLKDRDGNNVDAYNLVGGFTDETDFYFSNFILNEYCRELMGEPAMLHIQQMSGLRYARLMWHRQRGSTIDVDENGNNIWPKPAYNYIGTDQRSNGYSQGYLKPHFIWQPIVNSYLDKLTDENGQPLTQEMRDAYQNPGYVD